MTPMRRQLIGALVLVLALAAAVVVLIVTAGPRDCDELFDRAEAGEITVNQVPDACWDRRR